MEEGGAQRAGFTADQRATGSGVIVGPDGYIVTNAHVVIDARRIDISVIDGGQSGQPAKHKHLPATTVGLDRDSGIILSEIVPHGAAEASGLEPGDIVLAVDGKPIDQSRQLMAVVLQHVFGEGITLDVLPDLRRLSGVVVAAIPAEFAGLNPGLITGDAIYELNGSRIGTRKELRTALDGKKTGDPIALLIERSGQLVYVSLELE